MNVLFDPNFWRTATPESVQAAVQEGAKVNARDQWGWTPLHWAAASNPNPEIIHALVALGAEVNAKNRLGGTPLHSAARLSENSEVVLVLLELGADHRARGAGGRSAWDWAQDNEALKGTPAYKALERIKDVQPPV